MRMMGHRGNMSINAVYAVKKARAGNFLSQPNSDLFTDQKLSFSTIVEVIDLLRIIHIR